MYKFIVPEKFDGRRHFTTDETLFVSKFADDLYGTLVNTHVIVHLERIDIGFNIFQTFGKRLRHIGFRCLHFSFIKISV